MLSVEALAAWLGAAPGLAVVLRAAWRHRKLRQRRAERSGGEHGCAGGRHLPERRFDLWQRPHCFTRRAPGPAVAAARRAPMALRARFARDVLGGAVLAVAGAAIGWLVASVAS